MELTRRTSRTSKSVQTIDKNLFFIACKDFEKFLSCRQKEDQVHKLSLKLAGAFSGLFMFCSLKAEQC